MSQEQITYKDVLVPEQLDGLIEFMPGVERYREELSYLAGQWDLLTILGKMSGTAIDMSGTREDFQNLNSELLGQLGLETLKKTVQDIHAKAQVTVDIVIRNLFERTADIGFLATDDDIRQFLREVRDVDSDQDISDAKTTIISRFHEYVAKYSVYFDIVLCDTDGKIVARLDQENTITHSSDSLIKEALTTSNEYVEIFRPIDFLPNAGNALVYAYRVTENDRADSAPLGVLALCFRFDNEMEGVFNKLRHPTDWTVLTLLDNDGFVIASSDSDHIRIGAKMDLALEGEFRIVRYAGREYMAKTCVTQGYQGFMGLGWMGHVMLPLSHAFDQASNLDLGQRIDESVLMAVMNDPQLFSSELRGIPDQAEAIQSELERTVWNGNITKGDRAAKVLLWNISGTGARTKSVFESSIGNLHETAISAILEDVEFQAALAVDIMDRNLYERANDCRWWALTYEFKRILAQDSFTPVDQDKMTGILEYINGLYTVYTNLFVYDKNGKVLAVSNSAENGLVGTVLDQKWTKETMSLRNSQQYSVSPFEPTHLYNDQHTYVYGAAITHPHDSTQVLGGIGIVFDSTPQFSAMLQDSLSRDNKGNISAGCFGLFTNKNGVIISSTHSAYAVGECMNIEPQYLNLANGEKHSGIIVLENQYYAIGACTSSGYREYKVSDGYQNDIVGLIFIPLAQVLAQSNTLGKKINNYVDSTITWTASDEYTDYATFYIGDCWYGIESDYVLEAIRIKNMTSIPGSPPYICGTVLYNGHVIMVANMAHILSSDNARSGHANQIVVVECKVDGVQYRFGITVDALGETPQVSNELIDRSQEAVYQESSIIECIVKPGQHTKRKDMLLIMNPEYIIKTIAKYQPNDVQKPGLIQDRTEPGI